MDLWNLAAARLRDKDRKILDFGATVDLEELLSSVRDSRAECQRKRWVVNNVVLRDIFSKIAVWIQKFIEVGDVAIQYDPGHAALPWAAVRFVLKVSIQDVQRYSIVIEGIEKVAKIITRYRVVERLYLAEGSQSTEQLKDCLTELYVQVLVFLAKAKRFYAKNTTTRVLQSITDVRNKFQVQLERLGKEEQEVRMSKDLVDTQFLKDQGGHIADLSLKWSHDHQCLVSLLQDLERPINRMGKELEDVHDSLNTQEQAHILGWLSTIPYIQHHTQAQKDILAGTGQWFLNNERVLEWQKSSSSSIMWLHGPPGFGKSKLVSVCIASHRLQRTPSLLTANRAILIEKYLSDFGHGRNPNPVYFYCTRNPAEPERGSSEGVLRSLVKQLSCLQPGEIVLDPVRTVYEAREKNDFAAGSLNEKECTDLIIELCQYRPLTTIIIDALDECEPRRRHELFDAISTILQESKSLIKVLVASRDDRDITLFLEGCLNLEIDVSKSSEDIGHFVTEEVDRLVKSKRLLAGKVPADLCAEIERTLQSQAHGMLVNIISILDRLLPVQSSSHRFALHKSCILRAINIVEQHTMEIKLMSACLRFRWVSLQLQYLCGLKLEAAVRKRLGKLPPDLRELYNQTYVQMLDTYEDEDEDEEKSVTKTVFHLLMGLEKQLDTRDFIRAVSSYWQKRLELSQEDVLDLCGNFVVIDTGLDVFRFAHLSVREFLELKGGYEVEQNHAFAARCCMNYLSMMSHLDVRCAEYEPDDFKALGNNTTPKSVAASDDDPSAGGSMYKEKDLFGKSVFLNDFHAYACLYWLHHLAESRDCRMSPQFKDTYQDFIVGESGTVSRSFVYWNDFIWRNKVYKFHMYLPSGKWWDNHHGDKICSTISDPADYLFCASVWGFGDILELRIQSDPIALSPGASFVYIRALHLACTHDNFKEAKMLLEAGVRLDEQMMNRLLVDGLVGPQEVSLEDGKTISIIEPWNGDEQPNVYPLHAGATATSIPMLQLLLTYGADIEVKDDFGDTPLHVAAANGHEKAMSLLLAHQVDMNKSTKEFWTVATRLQKAVQTGSEGLLARLLADWPAGDQETLYLGRVLWNAVEREEVACVNLLLRKGASPDGVFRGWPILANALNIYYRYIPSLTEPTILKTLMEYGMNANLLVEGELALCYAICYCTDDAIRVLIDAGADIDARDGRPLREAIIQERPSRVRLLLERGANVNAKCYDGMSMLQHAKERELHEIVELLIQYGAEDWEEWHSDFVDSEKANSEEVGSEETDSEEVGSNDAGWETIGSDES